MSPSTRLFSHSFLCLSILCVSFLHTFHADAKLPEKITITQKSDLLSLPLLNFNARIHKFTLGQTEKGEIYIDIDLAESFNAYQARPYFREENFSSDQVTMYIQTNPEKFFAFNISLLEKDYPITFKGKATFLKDQNTIRLLLLHTSGSLSLLSRLTELQNIYYTNPTYTLILTILNYGTSFADHEQESFVPFYDRFNYLFYSQKGQTLKKYPSQAPDEPSKIQAVFRNVKNILVVPYEGSNQEIEAIEKFLSTWTKGSDNFRSSPPNGYVYTKDASGSYVRYDIRFLNPTYNAETKDLTFDVKFLHNAVTNEVVIPSVLENGEEFSTSYPALVFIDWKSS